MNIFIILCYGLFQDQKEYRQYLDRSLDIINSGNPDQIIICGGFTNRKLPKISEAKSVSDYLISKNHPLAKKIILEERSITTLENIKYAVEELLKFESKINKITFICDSVRLVKVYYIGAIFMSRFFGEKEGKKEEILLNLMRQIQDRKIDLIDDAQLEYGNIVFKGIGMSRNISEVGGQIPITLVESFCLDYPVLEEEALSTRKKEWGI